MRALLPTHASGGLRLCTTASICVLLAVLVALAWPAPGKAATTIGAGSGSGPEQGWEFGGIYDESDGQVITAPAGVTRLRSFTLSPREPTSFMFRGFVFAWNGSEATGPQLFESGDLHTTTGGTFQPFTIETDVPVTAGAQYVVFLSQTKDEAADEGITYGEALGMVTGEFETFPPTPPPYAEGGLVALHNGYRPEGWTTEAWYQPYNADAYFSATFAAPPAVASVAPTVARAGDRVTVTGTEFNRASEVLFGTTPASSFTVSGETEISAEVPSGVSGLLDVRVLTSAGESAAVSADEVTVTASAAPSPPPATTGQGAGGAAADPGAPSSPRRCVVPYLGGMKESAVKRALRAAHCRLGKVVHHYSSRGRGELVEQNRHRGTVAPAESRVSIWLSRGAHSKRHRPGRGA